MNKKILFVCRFNRFRSQFAEAIFNELNKNPKIIARSAGLIKGKPLDKKLLNMAKKNNLKLKGESESLSEENLAWQNTIVIVADNVPKSIFKEPRIKTNKIIQWNTSEAEAQSTIDSIEKKVNQLIKHIENR